MSTTIEQLIDLTKRPLFKLYHVLFAKAAEELATLRAENERLKELEAHVVKAHMAAFGPPRNYEFVDCISTINLFVGESAFSEGRRQENERLTQQLAETEAACRVLTLAANELETVRRERDEAVERASEMEDEKDEWNRDCSIALKQLLAVTAFNWEEGETYTADTFREHIQLTIEQLLAERDQLREQLEAVCDAAEPVIHRWDSPTWQWDTHTGVLVNALRAAVEKVRTK